MVVLAFNKFSRSSIRKQNQANVEAKASVLCKVIICCRVCRGKLEWLRIELALRLYEKGIANIEVLKLVENIVESRQHGRKTH